MTQRLITAQDLDYFYKHLFPAEQLFAWTQHGCQDPKENAKREYSITLSTEENRDGIFVRYNACTTAQKFRQLMMSRVGANLQWVSKLDIGPKFNGDVSRHKEKPLAPEEKELVFDIDMDDYNSVRTCCQDKKVCPSCFAFLSAAAKVLHHQLTNTFGFKHVLFVFSGRRGIHCWISDYEARTMTSRQREGLASYLNSGLQDNKKQLSRVLSHPVLKSSYELLKPDFEKLFETQTFFDSSAKRLALMQVYFDEPKKLYGKTLNEDTGSQQEAWEQLQLAALKSNQMDGIYRMVLDYLYPRLDIEVSKQFNHLLKSPFCIHPATGKVCVPIPYDQMSSFNPDQAPTLFNIMEEHRKAIQNGQQIPSFNFRGSEQLPKYISPIPLNGALATSLRPYIEFFTEFVAGVVKDELERKSEEHDMDEAINGKW